MGILHKYVDEKGQDIPNAYSKIKDIIIQNGDNGNIIFRTIPFTSKTKRLESESNNITYKDFAVPKDSPEGQTILNTIFTLSYEYLMANQQDYFINATSDEE